MVQISSLSEFVLGGTDGDNGGGSAPAPAGGGNGSSAVDPLSLLMLIPVVALRRRVRELTR